MKIEAGQVRFGFAYSKAKFHAWLHHGCAGPHLQQESACLSQAQSFLSQTLAMDKQPIEVRAAVAALQADLSRLSAASAIG